MENLFALIVLASFVLLVIGFFSPQTSLFWDKKNAATRKRSSLIYGITLIVSFILFGIISDKKKNSGSTNNLTSQVANSKMEKQAEEKIPELTQQQKDSVEKENIKNTIKEREGQTISAPNLAASYEANEVQADNNFKGKTFFVEGVVTDIKKDIVDDIYVILEGDQMFRDVQCFFNDAETASKLRKGMKVTFKGTCDGLMMNVLMKNCELVDNLSTMKKQSKR
jgi:hypothetical protein